MTDAATQPTVHKDNLLGICNAIGQDLGVNPLWLRLALGAMLLFNLELPFIVYGALGLIVIASRLLVPARRAGASAEVVQLATREKQPVNDEMEFAKAA